MPRNHPRAALDASIQTVVPLNSDLNPAPKIVHHPAPPGTKLSSSRIPAPQIERIKQRYIAGQSQRQISREEGRARRTIARIVTGAEMQAYVQEMRERFYGLAPDALATIEYALQEQKDARIAYEVLRDVGVIPRKGETPQAPASISQDGMSRQAIMVANVLLEAHENFGVDLPPEIEKALAESEDCESAKAKLAQPCAAKDVSD